MARSEVILTPNKRKQYELDAKTINFYRHNPCIAAEELLGVKLFDAQKWVLQMTWNTSHAAWSCSRNLGKSFLIAIFFLLKCMLYENLNCYIVAPVGAQSMETFNKIEQIVVRSGKTAASIRSLKDIAANETVKSPNNKTGFSHSPSGYEVHFYNGSAIYTLNGAVDNNRSRRADVVAFDEAAFASDNLIMVAEAFATQSSDFATSVDDDYTPELEPRKCPTQLIYASSQDSRSTIFFRHYREFAKEMLMGNKDYFCCDLPCNIAINTYMNGKQYIPLLTQDKVDAALKANPEKARREYYCIPTDDGGDNQIVRWATVRRNERFYLPMLHHETGCRYVIALDTARTIDNSIMTVMSIYNDPDNGWCGDIVNCVNFLDTSSDKRYKLDSNRQIAEIRKYILAYNGQDAEYANIESVAIDQGAGGGGTSTFADGLLNDWEDGHGTHRGLIDAHHDIYRGYEELYPNAADKLRLISPRKYRTQMFQEMIELMDLGVIRFPYEFTGNDYVTIANDDGSIETIDLTTEEQLALTQIDMLKNELTAIQRYKNNDGTSVTYALARDRSNMHDDRVYTLALLSHELYKLRRTESFKSVEDDEDDYIICVSPLTF